MSKKHGEQEVNDALPLPYRHCLFVTEIRADGQTMPFRGPGACETQSLK